MRNRSTPSGTVEVVDRSVDQKQKPILKFKDTLSWTAGKPIAVADLLRRLEALSKELRDLEQGKIERESLLSPAKELVNSKLLSHKDKGVRALTACCLADILRLCAPDAPYTPAQLKDIFNLFVQTVIPALSDPKNPYTAQHVYVLNSLVQAKSVILLTDIPSSNELLLILFTTCFDILSKAGENLSKNVEHLMTGMLIILVDEAQDLPHDLIDIILSQFMRADARTVMGMVGRPKNSGTDANGEDSVTKPNELAPAYTMARSICNSCAMRMMTYVSHYFSNVVMDISAPVDSPVKSQPRKRAGSDASEVQQDNAHGPTEEELKELRKAHRLLRELWRACPDVLPSVIPQLEVELSTDNVDLRLLATETIGDMVSGIGAVGSPVPPPLDPAAYPPLNLTTPSLDAFSHNSLTKPSSPKPFTQTHSSAYQSFLSRRNDKSAVVRSALTSSIGWILATRAGGTGLSSQQEQELTNYLCNMLVDHDEKVRLAAIKAVENFPFKDLVARLGTLGGVADPGSLFYNLADRVKDRKPVVRKEATQLLGKIWGVAAGEIANSNESVDKLFGAIPSRILVAFYVNDLEINALIDEVVFESLLPLSYPASKSKGKQQAGDQSKELTIDETDRIRTQRMLLVVKDLDQRAKPVFFTMLSRPMRLQAYVEAYLTRAEEYNGGVVNKKDTAIKQHLNQIIEYLAKSFPDSTRVSDDLWKFAKMHDRRSYQLIRFCKASDSDYRKIFKSRRELLKRIEAHNSGTSSMYETLKALIYHTSNFAYNKSHIPAIIQISQNNDHGLGPAAHEVLKEISGKCPDVFKAHVEELCRLLEGQAPSSIQATDQGTVDALKACAGFARAFPTEIPQDRKFFQAMTNYALRTSTPVAAKHAVTIIMVSADKKEMYAKDLLKKCTKNFKYGSDNFLSKLATLSQVLLFAADDAEEEIDVITDIAIEQILMKSRTVAPDDDVDWAEPPDEECSAKIWALRILVNRLRSFDDFNCAQETIKGVYKLLNTLVAKHGALAKTQSIPKSHKSSLRLEAALLLLKLCSVKGFDASLAPSAFNSLATVAQDTSFPVRSRFLGKVKKYLGQHRLPDRFYTIPFLVAFEPADKLKNDTFTWIRGRSAALGKVEKSQHVMELTFARLLSLLAHHPDLNDVEEDLAGFVPYLIFYLKSVASEDNISLIYYFAQRVKAVQDAIDSRKSENLYALSDLAQAIIRRFEELSGWAMQAIPQKLPLPARIFAALPNHEVAKAIASKEYVPEEVRDQLDNLVKGSLRTKKRKLDDDQEQPTRKRVSAPSATPTRKTKALPTHKPLKSKRTSNPKKSSDNVSRERRRSGRSTVQRSYADTGDSDDDADMEQWDHESEESIEAE